MKLSHYQKKIMRIRNEEEKLIAVRKHSRHAVITNSVYSPNYRKRHDHTRQEIARNIEIGHGRKRSLEWNSKECEKLQKEIEELKKRRNRAELGDNDFDRMAMK